MKYKLGLEKKIKTIDFYDLLRENDSESGFSLRKTKIH